MFSGLFSGLASSLIGGLAGFAGSAFQAKQNRNLMKYQYELDQRSLRESPTAQREGLLAAGYNPMLAITDGIASPTVSGSSVSAPDLSTFGDSIQSAFSKKKERESIDKQIERQDKLMGAELTKLNAETEAALANSGAAMYDARTRRMEASARIEKIKKEADSIDPLTERENQRYGRSHGNQQLIDTIRFVSDWWDGKLNNSSASPSSAKGAKVMNDVARSVQAARRARVREGLAHPRRKGRR